MTTMRFRPHLLKKVRLHTARLTVVGLGMVGLQVALASAKAGFRIKGVDTDRNRVASLNSGHAKGHGDKTEKTLNRTLRNGRFKATCDPAFDTDSPDFIVLCLPTPLTEDDKPDLSFLTATCDRLAKEDLSGKCIILESSVYPGVTRNILRPRLESGGCRAGLDFGLAHSPERIDFGNQRFPLERTPKLVGGINEASTDVACALYNSVLQAQVVRVESPEIAEAAKMLENTYRFVNICLVNELASVFEALGLNTYAVVDAAATKPFGFMAHYPGPGVGGHCIPKDPHYIMEAAAGVGKSLSIVEAGLSVDRKIPASIATRVEMVLNSVQKTMTGARVAMLGLAYKRDSSEARRSPALAVASEFAKRSAIVTAYDPLVTDTAGQQPFFKRFDSLQETVRNADVVVLATDHGVFRRIDLVKMRGLLGKDPIIFDARNFWDGCELSRIGYRYLGIGKPFCDRASGNDLERPAHKH